LDDYVDAWISTNNLDAVFNSPELDNVFFSMRDPTWIASVVNALDPNTVQGVAAQSASLHLDNTGGGGTGSGGSGSGSGSGGSGSGSKTGSGGSGSGSGSPAKPPKQGQASGCDTGSLGSFL